MKLGDQYFVIGDCLTTQTRDNCGNLQLDPVAFPNGAAAFAQEVKNEVADANLFVSWGVECAKHDGCWDPDCCSHDARGPARVRVQRKAGARKVREDGDGFAEHHRPGIAYGVRLGAMVRSRGAPGRADVANGV